VDGTVETAAAAGDAGRRDCAKVAPARRRAVLTAAAGTTRRKRAAAKQQHHASMQSRPSTARSDQGRSCTRRMPALRCCYGSAAQAQCSRQRGGRGARPRSRAALGLAAAPCHAVCCSSASPSPRAAPQEARRNIARVGPPPATPHGRAAATARAEPPAHRSTAPVHDVSLRPHPPPRCPTLRCAAARCAAAACGCWRQASQ
jgi:hypothetical protein